MWMAIKFMLVVVFSTGSVIAVETVRMDVVLEIQVYNTFSNPRLYRFLKYNDEGGKVSAEPGLGVNRVYVYDILGGGGVRQQEKELILIGKVGKSFFNDVKKISSVLSEMKKKHGDLVGPQKEGTSHFSIVFTTHPDGAKLRYRPLTYSKTPPDYINTIEAHLLTLKKHLRVTGVIANWELD